MSLVTDIVRATESLVTAGTCLVNTIMGGTNTKEVQDPKLIEELKAYREQNGQLVQQYADIVQKMQDQEVTTFDELAAKDQSTADDLVRLASQTAPITMQGNTIGFFGITSSGKSTLVNKLLDEEVAKVGMGETTTEVKAYPEKNGQFVLYDLPGRNDDMSYFTLEYVGFIKGLKSRVIIVMASIKHMTKVISLLEAIDQSYIIVANCPEPTEGKEQTKEERDEYVAKIQAEFNALPGKKGGNDKVYIISAVDPNKYKKDWSELIVKLGGKAA